VRFLQKLRYFFYRDYDPGWLVDAAEPYSNEYPWLQSALRKCIRAKDGGVYIHFISSANPNKPGSEWQFVRNITLENSIRGDLVLDVLSGNRIGGVEMIDEL